MSVLHYFTDIFSSVFSEIELSKLVSGCLIIHHICSTNRFSLVKLKKNTMNPREKAMLKWTQLWVY